MLQIAMLGARRTSCHAVNAFLTRSEKHQNVKKKRSWQKASGVNGLIWNSIGRVEK